MSDSIRFESSWKKDSERAEIKRARERVLEHAEKRAKREAGRREQEKSWMLPDLDRDLSEGKKSKKKKKKKEKKVKKDKKRKHSSSSEEDEWVEKKDVEKRESWMSLASSHQPSSSTTSSTVSAVKSSQSSDLDSAWLQRALRRAEEKKAQSSHDKCQELLAKANANEGGELAKSRSSISSKRSSGWRTSSSAAQNEAKQPEPEPKEQEKVPEQKADTKAVLTEREMNALGAKIVKAELMGNLEKAKKLKEQLEAARSAIAAKKEEASNEGIEEEDNNVVLLTVTDSKGMTRPLTGDPNPQSRDQKRKKGKVATHTEGQRVRYFADDDRYDLKQMFEREKLSTAEDQNSMMSRLAGKAINEKTDMDDFSIDDVFVSRAARKRSLEQEAAEEREAAIKQHRTMTRSLDNCSACFDSSEFKKHLLVAIGKTCYVSLPPFTSLTEDHCCIVPMGHTTCATMLDEDVHAEMQSFRKALCDMFESETRDCVFFEIATGLKRHHPHMILHCVPIPREDGDSAPMFFQKAIQECESEWAHNKKLITLTQERNVRRSVPKGLPYFHVDFGMQNGFAHVIEDEQEFPRNFAQEVIGGMLDLEPRVWRNPKRETFEEQKKKVLSFGAKWKKFNCGHSSESDSEEEEETS